MIRTLTLCLILAFLSLPLYAQLLTPQQDGLGQALSFNSAFVAANNIKSIKMEGMRIFYSGRMAPNGFNDYYEFDDSGKLIRFLQVHSDDTVQIKNYYYTEKGALFHHSVNDRQTHKRYKSYYRCNKDQSLYQVKSYEILNKDELMLLETRQYAYLPSGKVSSVYWLRNGSVRMEEHFAYDDLGRKTFECQVNTSGDTLHAASYQFREDLIVKNERSRIGLKQEYQFELDEAGNLIHIKWFRSGKETGGAIFNYDERGILKHMDYNNEADHYGALRKMCRIDYYE